MPNPWLNCPSLPAGASASLAALHFAEPRPEALAHLNDAERIAGLDFCHHSGLTLLVRDILPEATARDAANHLLRLRVLEETYRKMAQLPVDFVALKGITQCALFGVRPEDRPQSDIDLYCPRETVETAQDALMAAGYQPIAGLEALPTDHLPALMRPSSWKWRGDFFDPEMPLAVELHFQFWNPQLERLPAEGVDAFWTRRVRRPVGGALLAILSPADAVAYSALHLLKHVLHGSARPLHVYELASFLHRHVDDETFWKEWRALHSGALRRLQTVAFLLAEAWFGCRTAPAVREEVERLPTATRVWFEEFATSPAVQRFRANKDELWLHLSLLDSRLDAWRVARRRLIPSNLPPPARATSTQSSRSVYARWFAARLRHHVLSLGTTLTSGARWWWRTIPFRRPPSRELVLHRLLPVACIALSAGFALSAIPYYHDQRRHWTDAVLSNVLSRNDNPQGYLAAAFGTAVCGILLLPAASLFQFRLRQTSAGYAAAAAWTYRGGALSAVAMAVLEPFQTDPFSAVHVILAYTAFIGLTAGLALGMAGAARAASRAGEPAGWIRGFAAVEFAVLTWLVYLLFGPDTFDSRHWWSSLAACEWALCVSVAGYTAGLTSLLARTSR